MIGTGTWLRWEGGRPARSTLVVIPLLALLVAGGVVAQEERDLGVVVPKRLAVDPVPDARSKEVLRYDCRSEVTRREVTLFLNGTVRLRQGALGHEEMLLEELTPEAVQDVLRALRAIQDGPERAEGTVPTLRTGGDWVGRCRYTLSLPEGPPETFEFAELDTLPLFLRKLVDLANVLSEDVEPVAERVRLPTTYEPEVDDVLVDTDGFRWLVVRFTTDDRAVELRGLDQPFTRYVDREAIREMFVDLEDGTRR